MWLNPDQSVGAIGSSASMRSLLDCSGEGFSNEEFLIPLNGRLRQRMEGLTSTCINSFTLACLVID